MQKSRALFLPSVEMSRGIVQAARPTHARCTACPPEVAGRRKSMISSAKPGGGIAQPSVGSSCLSSVQRMSADSEIRHHSCRGSVYAPPGGPPAIDGNSVVGIAYGAKRPSSVSQVPTQRQPALMVKVSAPRARHDGAVLLEG